MVWVLILFDENKRTVWVVRVRTNRRNINIVNDMSAQEQRLCVCVCMCVCVCVLERVEIIYLALLGPYPYSFSDLPRRDLNLPMSPRFTLPSASPF